METKTYIVIEETSPYGDYIRHEWSSVEEALASERFDFLKEQYNEDDEMNDWDALKIEECETIPELVAKVGFFRLDDQSEDDYTHENALREMMEWEREVLRALNRHLACSEKQLKQLNEYEEMLG